MGEPTLAKKQKFLAGVVCSLIVLELVNVVTRVGDAFVYAPRHADLLSILGSLLAILVLLKFLLPDWRPHRAWLGGLLGFSLAVSLSVFVYGVYAMTHSAGYTGSDIAAILSREFVEITLFNPYFYLLIGLVFNKRTEKLTAIIYTFVIGLTAILGIGIIPARDIISTLLFGAGYIVIYFNWPVLTRPILENPA